MYDTYHDLGVIVRAMLQIKFIEQNCIGIDIFTWLVQNSN